jgi:two-component system phosphate regulon response regulator PhoB
MDATEVPINVDGANVLVVDDDKVNRALFGAVLKKVGLRVTFAVDGSEALASTALELPDIVLLDYMMPGITGVEVLKRLRADPRTRGLPVLMVTASTQEEHVTAIFEAGADDYLIKPITPQLLRTRVLTVLRQRRAGAALDETQRM